MATEPLESASDSPDRRRFQRLKFQGKIEIEWGSATLTGTVRDICADGMFIELMPPLWMGAAFSARLAVTPILQMHCTVRRVDPGRGIAVTFEVPEESGKAQLGTLLAALPLI
jgi:hypothetical protein